MKITSFGADKMFSLNFVHTTPRGKIIIDVQGLAIEAPALNSFLDKDKFQKLCADGCPNYNNKWSCPPFSPSYLDWSQSYQTALVLLFTCNLSQLDYIKNQYMKVRAANSILKSNSYKLLKYLEESLPGVMMPSGSCRLCVPCNRKKGLDCKKPTQLRFSMESLGLDLGRISADLLNHQLMWYQDKLAPQLTSALTGFLVSNNVHESDIELLIQGYYQDNGKNVLQADV